MAGGIDGEYGEIVLGGPFTGKAVELSTPITKTSGGILVTEPFKDLKGAKMGILLALVAEIWKNGRFCARSTMR